MIGMGLSGGIRLGREEARTFLMAGLWRFVR